MTDVDEPVREELLRRCDAAMRGAQQRRDDSRRAVLDGMHAARAAIVDLPGDGDDRRWLTALLARLEVVRSELDDDARDPDGWSLGGLRTIANLVEDELRWRTEPPWRRWWRRLTGRSARR